MDKGSVLHNLEKSGESQKFFHDSMVIEAFENQRYFIRLFNEYEVNFSNVETYSECVIRMLDIDRIYRYKHYHDTDDNGINCYLEIYCRSKNCFNEAIFLGILYKRELLCDNIFFNEKNKSGVLFLTKDVNIFCNSLMNASFPSDIIYASFKRDNYHIYGDSNFENYFRKCTINTDLPIFSTLEMTCIHVLYKHYRKNVVSKNGNFLLKKGEIPKHLERKITNFIIYYSSKKMFQILFSEYFKTW